MLSITNAEASRPGQIFLLFILSGLVVLYAILIPFYRLAFHPLRHVPGPKLYAISYIPHFRLLVSGKAHQKILEFHQKYGDTVRVSPNEVSFSSPEAWRDVMGYKKGTKEENGKDPVFYKYLTTPGSILGANREDHARIRQIVAPGFSAQAMLNQEPLIKGYVDLLISSLLKRCHGGKTAINLELWFNFATFDIIGDLTFAEPFDCLKVGEYHPWISLIFKSVKLSTYQFELHRLPILSKFIKNPTPKDLPEKRAQHIALTTAKVSKRIELGSSRPDLMESLVSKEGRDNRKLTFQEIRGTAQTFIVAGSETTATALTATIFYLTTHPDVLKKLTDEVRSSLRNEDEINFISVQNMRYMLAVLDESLRMHPPVANISPREARPGGTVVSGYYMPGGTTLGLWHWAIYHNEKHFLMPNSFIPERWLGDPRFANDKTEVFQPFSYGTRNCIGKNLAYAEMRLILARLIWNFDLRLSDDCRNWEKEELTYFFWEKGPLNVYLTPIRA